MKLTISEGNYLFTLFFIVRHHFFIIKIL